MRVKRAEKFIKYIRIVRKYSNFLDFYENFQLVKPGLGSGLWKVGGTGLGTGSPVKVPVPEKVPLGQNLRDSGPGVP